MAVVRSRKIAERCLFPLEQLFSDKKKGRNYHTFDTLLIRGDGSALDSHIVFLDGFRAVDGHLVIRLVTVGEAKVIILALHVHIGEDQLQVTKTEIEDMRDG